MQITPRKKSYILRYTVGGRKKQTILGRCSEISLRAAREMAGTELANIRSGQLDPLERKLEAKLAPTVNEMLDRFFVEFVPARIEAKRLCENTVKEYRKQSRFVRSKIGGRKIGMIGRREIEVLVCGIDAPTMRNRTLAFLSRVFTLAETWEYRQPGTNPCRGITRTKEEPRDRVLSNSELAKLNDQLIEMEADHPFAVAAIRIAAMTGLRIGEVLSLRWKNVDLDASRLVLPQTKTGRRIIPLVDPVVDVLTRLPRVNGNEWVFAGAYENTHITYRTLRKYFAMATSQAKLVDVKLHDLRRSVATNLAAAGANAFILRDVLGHKTIAMSSRYVRLASDALREAHETAASIMWRAMMGNKANLLLLRDSLIW